jgi:hypothetical protein
LQNLPFAKRSGADVSSTAVFVQIPFDMRFWEKFLGSSSKDDPSAATKSAPPVQSNPASAPLTQEPIPSPKTQGSAAGIGYDCPYYSQGMCLVGGGHRGGGHDLCSLGTGNYWTDCYVYPNTGLKGKYDKEKGEDARRRAHLKKCNRCKVSLQVPENVDFRYAIGEFASEHEFTITSDAAGVSCAVCHADFCHKCMVTFGERHPSSGGLACLTCGGRMTKFNP